MLPPKKEHAPLKLQLHPRNKHRARYNLQALITTSPELAQYVAINNYNDESIDFFNPDAVLALNKALLQHYYGITHWHIPPHYLCPPIPGRADYIHYIADLLQLSNNGILPTGKHIRCLDIGVGANCVYPIIGANEYDWEFVGTDIDAVAAHNATTIIAQNECLQPNVEIRTQTNPNNVFRGIINPNELFDVTICNPPFHASLAEAQAGTERKTKNLTGSKSSKSTLNFGGQNNELWCNGGEQQFVRNMILESSQFKHSCLWFTTLISKQSNLQHAYNTLKQVQALEVKTIDMGQGNKISRVLAWTFLTSQQETQWVKDRWTELK